MPSYQIDDRVLAAKYLEHKGYHYTLALTNRGDWLSANTFLYHDGDAVWQVGYRNPKYQSYGVGTRLMDLSFHWAAEKGFRKVAIGGNHEYKIRWAPIDCVKQHLTICPDHALN